MADRHVCDHCKKEMTKHVTLYDWDTFKYHTVHFRCWRLATADYWMTTELQNKADSTKKQYNNNNH